MFIIPGLSELGLTHLIVLSDDGALVRAARLDRRAGVDEAVLAIAVD